MRPEPRQPDSHAQDPWFVAPEPKNTNKPSMKRIVKRTVSILFPIAGLLALIGVILYVVNVVVETYG